MSQAFGALGGSVVGGLVGSAVEKTAGATRAYEYIVRKTNGDMLSVTQQDKTPLEIGAKVLVIAGSQARIVPDYTVAVDPAPPEAKTDLKDPLSPPVAAAPLPPPGPKDDTPGPYYASKYPDRQCERSDAVRASTRQTSYAWRHGLLRLRLAMTALARLQPSANTAAG